MSVEEVNRVHATGKWAGREKDAEASQAIIEGLEECYYPILDSLDAPAASGNRVSWVEGERLAFGFFECAAGYRRAPENTEHEEFMYVLNGKIDMRVDNDRQDVGPGDVIEVPRGAEREFTVAADMPARYVVIKSMPYLEERIDA